MCKHMRIEVVLACTRNLLAYVVLGISLCMHQSKIELICTYMYGYMVTLLQICLFVSLINLMHITQSVPFSVQAIFEFSRIF